VVAPQARGANYQIVCRCKGRFYDLEVLQRTELVGGGVEYTLRWVGANADMPLLLSLTVFSHILTIASIHERAIIHTYSHWITHNELFY
jgi:uncharacterized membrane protein